MDKKMDSVLRILLEQFPPKPELTSQPSIRRVTIQKRMGVSIDEGPWCNWVWWHRYCRTLKGLGVQSGCAHTGPHCPAWRRATFYLLLNPSNDTQPQFSRHHSPCKLNMALQHLSVNVSLSDNMFTLSAHNGRQHITHQVIVNRLGTFTFGLSWCKSFDSNAVK